jgi:hypothetical protein
MTVKEIKEWLSSIPEEMNDVPLVIRTLNNTEEEGKFAQKDEPIVSAMIDQNTKRLCFFNIESQKVIEEIRAALKDKKDQPEGTNK